MKYFVIILSILSALVKIYISSEQPLLNEWDERFHGVVASNIVEDQLWFRPTLYQNPVLYYDTEDWAKSHIWMHKQPLPFWTISLSIQSIGRSAFAVRLPSILFVSLAIFLTFLIGKSLFDEKIGVGGALLFSIHGLTNELSIGIEATDHIDIHFMFWIILAAYLITTSPIRNRRINCALIGITLGFAVLVKWLPAYTILITFIAYEWRLGQLRKIFVESLIIVICSVIIWIPWQLYAYTLFHDVYLATQAHNFQHIVEYLEGHRNGYLYFFDKSIYNYGEIWILSLLLLIFHVIKSTLKEYKFLLSWIIIPFMFFTFVATKMQGYIYFTAPAIFIASAFALKKIYALQNWHWIPIGKLLFFLSLISPFVHFYESLHPREHEKHLVSRLVSLQNRNLDETVIFNSPTPYNDMFFLDVVASYDYIPDERTLDSLRNIYNIIIED